MSDRPEDFDDSWFEDADLVSDRASTISVVALVELMLADAIRACFVKLSRTKDDELFRDRGPLGTLAAKIDIGFALGIYGEKTRPQLHMIRRIRNRFAHHHEADSFDHPLVLQLCDDLPKTKADGSQYEYTRERFTAAVLRSTFHLSSVQLERESSRPNPPDNLP